MAEFKPIGLADEPTQFVPVALADEPTQFVPVALADEPVTFQPVAEAYPLAPEKEKRLNKATPRKYKSIAFLPFAGKIEGEIGSEDVAKAETPRDPGVLRDDSGNIIGEMGVQESLTEPKNMALGAAGTLVGGTIFGAAGIRVGGAIGKALSGALETTIPIELASTLTGGLSDVGRMVKGAVKGAFAKKPKITMDMVGKVQDPAMKVEMMYDAAEQAVKDHRKVTVEQILKKTKTRFIDTSGNVKDELLKLGPEGRDTVVAFDLTRGASSISDMELKGHQQNIYNALTPDDERDLNRIIASRSTIAIKNRNEEVARTAGLQANDHNAFLQKKAYENPERFAALNQRADEYFKVMRGELDKAFGAGLIDQKSYDNLVNSGDYSKSKFLQYIDPDQAYTFGGKQVSVPSSGIQRLRKGSEEAMEINSRLLMAEVVMRNNARIMKNNANLQLLNIGRMDKARTGGLVKEVPPQPKPIVGPDGETKWISVAPHPSAGHEIIHVMENGKKRYIEVPSEFAQGWVMSDPQISKEFANTVGWLSGGKILKPMATGLNPEFALTNFARDLAHIFLTTNEYSPVLPKAMAQQAVDLVATAKDAIFRSGSYNRYIAQGGGMEFLTHQGRPSQLGSTINKLYNVAGYLGETTEIWTRLALRRRALVNAVKQGVPMSKAEKYATHTARTYLDFVQGGSFIKALDTGIPYLNAAVQATRGLGKAVIDNPGLFTAKLAQISGLAAGIYYANRFVNPEAWEQISDREKSGNFIITTPLYYRDKNGDKRHLYFKIAKDQSQRVFASLAENLAAMAIGDKFSMTQIGQSLRDAMPIIPTGMMPPTFEAMLGYASNKNFYRNEDIWKGVKGVDPKQEWDRYTPEIYKKMGEVTGMSPLRTKYAIEQVFTSGNVWTSLVGLGMSALLKELPRDVREQSMAEIVSKQPFIRKVMRSTDPYAKYEDEISNLKSEAATRRLVQRREFEAKAEDYVRGRASREEVINYIMEQPRHKQKTMMRKFNDYIKMGDMPDKKWWIELKYADPDTRAELFHRRYEKARPEEQERLRQWLDRIPGIRSDRFNYKLRELRNEN